MTLHKKDRKHWLDACCLRQLKKRNTGLLCLDITFRTLYNRSDHLTADYSRRATQEAFKAQVESDAFFSGHCLLIDDSWSTSICHTIAHYRTWYLQHCWLLYWQSDWENVLCAFIFLLLQGPKCLQDFDELMPHVECWVVHQGLTLSSKSAALNLD